MGEAADTSFKGRQLLLKVPQSEQQWVPMWVWDTGAENKELGVAWGSKLQGRTVLTSATAGFRSLCGNYFPQCTEN